MCIFKYIIGCVGTIGQAELIANNEQGKNDKLLAADFFGTDKFLWLQEGW